MARKRDEYRAADATRGKHSRAAQPQPNAAEQGGAHTAATSSSNKKNKKKRKRGRAWTVVFWIALVILILALLALGIIGYSYWQGRQTYDEVAEAAFEAPDDAESTPLDEFVVDWDALSAINPDIVGWIYIPDTVVNYPIVQGDDNEYYLEHDFYGQEGWAARFGSIFLAAENEADFSDECNLIYGHHMADGSMFGLIGDMIDQEVFDANRTIYILTPQGNYRLGTFALVDVDAYDNEVTVGNFYDADKLAEYLQGLIDGSLVQASDLPDVALMEKLFMFCTCDEISSDGRYLLCAYVAESTVEGDELESIDGQTDSEDAQAVQDAAEETEENAS